MGSEMLAPTEKQRKLVEAFVANGGRLIDAAREAGYSVTSKGDCNAARHAMRQPHVQQLMHAEVLDRMGRHVPQMLARVAELAANGKSEYVSLQAAQDLLDRAGYKPIERQQTQVQADVRITIDLG